MVVEEGSWVKPVPRRRFWDWGSSDGSTWSPGRRVTSDIISSRDCVGAVLLSYGT